MKTSIATGAQDENRTHDLRITSRIKVKACMRKIFFTTLVFAMISLVSQRAEAVTYGEPVLKPSKMFPSVVSVWFDNSKSGDPKKSKFLCTATLIESKVALTAAHCIQGLKGNWYVAVGADRLGKGRFIPVDAVWYSSRYSAKRIANDIGMLHLQSSAGLKKYASVSKVNNVTSKSKLQIVGWGIDQNGDLSKDLNKIKVTLDTRGGRQSFGTEFNERTTIAAGRYIKAERLYGGACNGDSGGPLFIAGTLTIVGTVSYGVQGCDAYAPTVFARVSYYSKDILAGLKLIKKKAKESSIAPTSTTPPRNAPGDDAPGDDAPGDDAPGGTAPGAPTAIAGTAGDKTVTLTWTAPTSKGGSAITDYVIRYSGNIGSSWTKLFASKPSISTSGTVTGLSNGVSYLFQVAATNSIGTGNYSASSLAVTPGTAPGAPTAIAGIAGNTTVALTWTAPTSTGGLPISDYVVQYSSNSGSTWTTFLDSVSTTTSGTVTGLSNYATYYFKVAATNSIGTGEYSTVTGATIPSGCSTGGICAVGNTSPSGGTVVYVAPTAFTSTGSDCATNCLYLEAAPNGWGNGGTTCGNTGSETVDPKCAWSGNTSSTLIGATAQGTAIGTGFSNTIAIMAQSSGGATPNKAATTARAYNGGGKTDWFLPSKSELYEFCKYATGCGLDEGVPRERIYWSSSEYNRYTAWTQSFYNGVPGCCSGKSDNYYVRPVRAF